MRYKLFRSKISARRYMLAHMRKYNLPELSHDQIKEAKAFYKSNGYILKNTYWHKYYTGINGRFHKEYMPYDIFNAIINPRLNQTRQWPALLDKNLSYNLFKEFRQPKCVIQNINGFYFINNDLVEIEEAIKACENLRTKLIIKPTINSGNGRMVNAFNTQGYKTSLEGLSLRQMFKQYRKNFIVQEYLEQSDVLKSLNPSSLNTLRMVSYLNKDGVHILSSVLRVGQKGSVTDNFSSGGIFCGINKNGQLKGTGYDSKANEVSSLSGVRLNTLRISNFDKVKNMITDMHHVVPYFKIISWDIGINKDNLPFLIEYNTSKQGVDLQIATGPYLGDFTSEILALAREGN